MEKLKYILIVITTIFCIELNAQQVNPTLIIIGVDGLSSWGLKKYEHKVLDSLMNAGSYTLNAKAVIPTLSAPNWASILTGVNPNVHKIKNNHWKKSLSDSLTYDTFFKKYKSKNKTDKVAIFYHWKNFEDLIEKEFVDTMNHSQGEEQVMSNAVNYIVHERPNLVFIHLDLVDSAGHHFGLKSFQYKEAIEKVDYLIGNFINSITNSELKNNYRLLITSDHGFYNIHHGGIRRTERNIPLIVTGQGINTFLIRNKVKTEDTTLLIEYMLGLNTPSTKKRWIKKVVS